MGLDISAYRQLSPRPDAPVDADGYPLDDDFTYLSRSLVDYTEQHFPGRVNGVTAGVYRPAEAVVFRAGSYSGYNWWRNHLAEFAHGMPADKVWSAMSSGAFFEMISFSDCEGIIGPVVAVKLAKDFHDHEARAVEYAAKMAEDGEWWLVSYRRWMAAFDMAADGGAVLFH